MAFAIVACFDSASDGTIARTRRDDGGRTGIRLADEYRDWLRRRPAACEGAWIAFAKGRSGGTLAAAEALEEALCFGWIDGRIKRVDEGSYVKYFAPHREGSPWSERNKRMVEGLTARGLMAEPGLRAVRAAKERGT